MGDGFEKEEKLAIIAGIFLCVSVILFYIWLTTKIPEGLGAMQYICIIISIPVYLTGLIMAIIAKIKCKYSSLVHSIFRFYIYATCSILALIIAFFLFVHWVKNCNIY